MPPKKSNLNNACSREARRKRAARVLKSVRQTAATNTTKGSRVNENRTQESSEQRDERCILNKYWCDWKYRVRRRALELRAARDSNRTPPDGVTQLSTMEETILSIIGDSAVDGIVIKSDPLADGATEEEAQSYHNDEAAANQYCETRQRPRRVRKRRHSSKDTSDVDDRSESVSPVDRKPRMGTEKNGHMDELGINKI